MAACFVHQQPRVLAEKRLASHVRVRGPSVARAHHKSQRKRLAQHAGLQHALRLAVPWLEAPVLVHHQPHLVLLPGRRIERKKKKKKGGERGRRKEEKEEEERRRKRKRKKKKKKGGGRGRGRGKSRKEEHENEEKGLKNAQSPPTPPPPPPEHRRPGLPPPRTSK